MKEISDTPRGKKPVCLKQHMIIGIEKGNWSDKKIAYILATCGTTARQEFLKKFPNASIVQVTVTAYSEITKAEAESRNFWKEKMNWIVDSGHQAESKSVKRYFELKKRAEENTARLGVKHIV